MCARPGWNRIRTYSIQHFGFNYFWKTFKILKYLPVLFKSCLFSGAFKNTLNPLQHYQNFCGFSRPHVWYKPQAALFYIIIGIDDEPTSSSSNDSSQQLSRAQKNTKKTYTNRLAIMELYSPATIRVYVTYQLFPRTTSWHPGWGNGFTTKQQYGVTFLRFPIKYNTAVQQYTDYSSTSTGAHGLKTGVLSEEHPV